MFYVGLESLQKFIVLQMEINSMLAKTMGKETEKQLTDMLNKFIEDNPHGNAGQSTVPDRDGGATADQGDAEVKGYRPGPGE